MKTEFRLFSDNHLQGLSKNCDGLDLRFTRTIKYQRDKNTLL